MIKEGKGRPKMAAFPIFAINIPLKNNYFNPNFSAVFTRHNYNFKCSFKTRHRNYVSRSRRDLTVNKF